MVKEDEQFHWDLLIPHSVHPTKVAIIEAMAYLREPLSASQLTKLFGDKGKIDLAHVSYHVVALADVGVLRVVRKRHVRGAVETFYSFS